MTHDNTAPATGPVSSGDSELRGTDSTAEPFAPVGLRAESLPARPAVFPVDGFWNNTPGSVDDERWAAFSSGADKNARFEAAPVQDEQYRELLNQVRLLRQHLPLFADAQEIAEVEAELVEAEEEIIRTGAMSPGLLSRLRERLQQASTALGGLSSALALAETVRKLTD